MCKHFGKGYCERTYQHCSSPHKRPLWWCEKFPHCTVNASSHAVFHFHRQIRPHISLQVHPCLFEPRFFSFTIYHPIWSVCCWRVQFARSPIFGPRGCTPMGPNMMTGNAPALWWTSGTCWCKHYELFLNIYINPPQRTYIWSVHTALQEYMCKSCDCTCYFKPERT